MIDALFTNNSFLFFDHGDAIADAILAVIA
jgi:hypothetical protein